MNKTIGKILEWVAWILGGFFLICTGWQLKTWDLAGCPDPPSGEYWAVLIFFVLAILEFIAVHFIKKENV